MQQSAENSQELSVFNLTIEGFWQLQTNGIDLNNLFVLECLNQGTDIEKHVKGSSKIKAWKQNLYRKSLVTEKGEVTVLGKELLASLISSNPSPREVIKKVTSSTDDAFEKWWKEYPSTDTLNYLNKSFPGSRGLRQKKEECRKKFGEILLEGNYTPDDMIAALKVELMMKMNQSVRDNENKMKYMQNTLTYLNQKTFENFVDLAKDLKVIPDPTSSSTVDI